MEPVEIVGVVLVRGRECEFAMTVFVDYVVDAGCRFVEREASILYYGSLAERIQVFDGLRGEEGGALVELQVVVDLKFFAEPGEALGL